MSGLYDSAAFTEFCSVRRAALNRIAGHAGQATQTGDVMSTAWEMAHKLHTEKGIDIDFRDVCCQDLIIRYTYQTLVAYTEKTLRYATRLDKAPPGSDSDCHPLMRRLHDPDALGPLEQLIAVEEKQANEPPLNPHHSLARAYVLLLQNFHGWVPAIAHYLRISVSHTYRCCAHARDLEQRQLPIPIHIRDIAFKPRPWRSFKLYRTQQQLALDFGEDLFNRP